MADVGLGAYSDAWLEEDLLSERLERGVGCGGAIIELFALRSGVLQKGTKMLVVEGNVQDVMTICQVEMQLELVLIEQLMLQGHGSLPSDSKERSTLSFLQIREKSKGEVVPVHDAENDLGELNGSVIVSDHGRKDKIVSKRCVTNI